MEHPINESAWRRGWNDTKTVWTSWPFYVLDAVVAVVITAIFGWGWGLTIILFGMLCVWLGATASAPVKQRNEAREKLLKLQDTLGSVGWIEAVIIDGVDFSNKIKKERYIAFSLCEQKELDDFGEWYTDISTYLQKHMPGEYPFWYRSVFIGNDEPSVTEVLKAYESGLDILEDIRKKLSPSIAHTGSS